MHADGAGTKSSVAYLVYAESGDASVFRGIAQDSLVMNTDDLLCVGATSGFLVSNTIGRNAHRVRGDVIAALIDGYEACAAMLREYGVEITLTGGETAHGDRRFDGVRAGAAGERGRLFARRAG